MRNVVVLAVAFAGVAVLYGAAAATVHAGAAAELTPELAYSAPDGIHLIRADGTDDHRVPTSRSGDDAPAWSPDGHRLAVISKKNGAGFGRLFVLDLVAGRRVQLPAAGASVASATWSSDGSTVYFDNGVESVLSSIRSDGSHLAKPLGRTPGIYPAVGPDGRLAYTYNWYPAPSIFVFDPALGIVPGPR